MESEVEENQNDDSDKETAADGTIWIKSSITDSASKRVGRASEHNVIKVIPGPTPLAKRRMSSILTAFTLIIDDELIEHIRKCTETEAHRSMGNTDWSISLTELKAFVSVLYARGALGLKNMSVANIFSPKYGAELIRGTMSRDRFKSIMRYLRFDIKVVVVNDFLQTNSLWQEKFGIDSFATAVRPTNQEKTSPSTSNCFHQKPVVLSRSFYRRNQTNLG